MENNSASSSGETARFRAAYDPLYAGSLYDFPRSMIDREQHYFDSDDIRDEDGEQMDMEEQMMYYDRDDLTRYSLG